MNQIRRIHPQTSWIVGDYTTGSSVEAIAERYGLEVEAVKAIVEYGMEERERKRAEAMPEQISQSEGRQAEPTEPVEVLAPEISNEYSIWMPLERLAQALGVDEYDLLWWIDTPEGDALGLECTQLNGGGAHLYRAFKNTETT